MLIYPKPNVFISKCLGFDKCRWNGITIYDKFVKKLLPFVNYITTCPEIDIGLGAPRDPIRIVQLEGNLKLIQPATKTDFTKEMIDFSESYLHSIKEKDLDGFILKNRSPSCGIKDVRIYPKIEKCAALTAKAKGFFGKKVYEYYPNLAIEDEGRLRNDEIRENYLTKLFILARFRQVKKKAKFNSLLDFHTRNKFLLRIYNQKEMRNMGRLVGNRTKISMEDLLSKYEVHLSKALAKSARKTAIIDALLHFLGFFSKKLESEEKAFFLDNLEKYRAGEIPLSNLIILLRSWIIRFDEEYLKEQTFFSPYPTDLVNIY